MAAKGLTRKITRKQARSYNRLVPNGIGVTAIAALSNGKRSAKGKSSMAKKRLSGAAFKRSAQYKKMMAGLRRHKAKANGTKRARRNPFETGYKAPVVGGEFFVPAGSKVYGGAPGKEVKFTKKEIAAAKAAAERELRKVKKARAAKKVESGKKRAAKTRARVGASYGPFKSVKAQIGGHNTPTYSYRGSKGRVSKIPLWAILGAKSEKDLKTRVANQATASDRNLARRVVAAKKRRDRAANKVLLHGDLFTPNKTVSFKSWSENKMNENKKGKKRRTAKQKAATKRMIAANKASRRGGSKKRKKSGSVKRRRATPNMRKGSKHSAATKAKMKRAQRKRHRTAGTAKRKTTAKRKPAAKRRKTGTRLKSTLRGKARKALAKRLNKRHPGHRYWANEGTATPNRRRRARKHYAENRRRHARRRYHRNPGLEQIKAVAMIGVSVTLGFFAHRALTHVVSESLLTKVDSFTTGSLAKYRGVIGGFAVALVGIPLVAKAIPKHAASIGAGMVTSFLQKLVVTALSEMGQPDAAGYLSGLDYGDRPGSAYPGLGEYYQSSMSGFGADPFMQAAAGYGALPAFTQAAAGYGATPFMQAAAGFGAHRALPAYEQAAAGYGEYITQGTNGVGEYVATGLRGIGEYESTGIQGTGGFGECVEEGINPDVDSAEDALTEAEQMSGIGDIPTGSIWQATQQTDAIADSPRGARAGILQGGGGIFGGPG